MKEVSVGRTRVGQNMGDVLNEVHDLEPFRAKNHDPRFQEDQVVRFRGQEEILIKGISNAAPNIFVDDLPCTLGTNQTSVHVDQSGNRKWVELSSVR